MVLLEPKRGTELPVEKLDIRNLDRSPLLSSTSYLIQETAA